MTERPHDICQTAPLPDRFFRRFLLAGASVTTLMMGSLAGAEARGLGNSGRTSAAAPAAAQAAAQQAAAAAAAAQASISMTRVTAGLQAVRAKLASDRAAAMAAPSAVPNGLTAGGLVVSPGVPADATLWQGANAPVSTGSGGRTRVEVKQTQPKAILTWSSFNVGRETDLYFNQTAGGSDVPNWIVLNRVIDPSLAPSRILGTIKSEGQVYVINRNGIVFGGSSQVNVSTLVVSSLEIALPGISGAAYLSDSAASLAARNSRFLSGLLSFTGDLPVAFGEDFTTVSQRSLAGEVFAAQDGVTIDAGAQIRIGNYGQAFLAGHNITNRGTIEAPNGQVVLAAGRGIVVNKSALPDIRSYLVAVDRGGVAENSGLISTALGNITITGKHINQTGALFATTGVEANGSIVLRATEGMPSRIASTETTAPSVDVGYVGAPNANQRRGTVTFGEGSLTAILPDDSGQNAVGTSSYRPSMMDVYGYRILALDDSTLYLPSGRIGLWAQVETNNGATDSRVFIGQGARIDVSGLRDVLVPMEQNSIEAELRAAELNSNPVLRDSPLRGRKISFDARRGIAIADVAGYYDLIARDINQFMTPGGSIAMRGKEIITQRGSTIDLSGGSVRYLDGYIKSTSLMDQSGRRVRIEDAIPGVLYFEDNGAFAVSHPRWGVTEFYSSPLSRGSSAQFVKGYVEGRSAGRLDLDVDKDSGTLALARDAFRIFDGDVLTGLTIGPNQLSAPTGATISDVTRIWQEMPTGATLMMGGALSLALQDATYIGGDITIANVGPRLASGFRFDTALDYANAYIHTLPAAWFDGDGFGNVILRSGYTSQGPFNETTSTYGMGPYAPAGHLVIGEGVTVDLGAFGSFRFFGRQADIAGTVRAPGGAVSIQTVQAPSSYAGGATQNWASIPEAERPGTHLRASAVIDVAGTWVNDFLDRDRLSPRAIDGGSVSIVSYNFTADEGSLIDVGGGGHLDGSGDKLTAGNGGSIVIDTSVRYTWANPTLEQVPNNGRLELNGTLRGYALGQGGSLSIDSGDEIFIGGEPVLPSGILAPGEAAPRALRLASSVVVAAGSRLPVAGTYVLTRVEPGQAMPVAAAATGVSATTPLLVVNAWTVPTGVQVRSVANTLYRAGTIVPAGTQLMTWTGSMQAGYVVPANVFPQGIATVPTTATHLAGIATRDVTIAAFTIIPTGALFDQQVLFISPRMVAPDFFTQGGFSGFAISGARGLTVAAGAVIAPSVETLRLENPNQLATGTRLADAAERAVLPGEFRTPMTLSLSTVPVDIESGLAVTRVDVVQGTGLVSAGSARYPGVLTVEDGAQIQMEPGSAVRLASLNNLFVDGSVTTPGGRVELLSPVIRLGAHARLAAAGYVDVTHDGRQLKRNVAAGGTILLAGGRSSAATAPWASAATVLIDPGAVIDVSGIRDVADLTRSGGRPFASRSPYAAAMIDGSAGAISIYATKGVLGGQFQLAPGGETGRGGTLEIRTTIASTTNDPGILVRQDMLPGFGPVTQSSGVPSLAGLIVVADRINGSGLDDLVLGSAVHGDPSNLGIRFDGDVTLTSRRSLSLVTHLLGTTANRPARVELASSYVTLGSGPVNSGNPLASATALNGDLTVRADLIDVVTRLYLGCGAGACASVGGFDSARFIATGDIRLHAGDTGTAAQPAGLFSAGSLAFDAAQVYVTARAGAARANDNPGFVVSSNRSITITGNGNPALVPYSFGERLTVRAPVIVQGGVLRAPQGQIRLEASQSLTLAPGSLTSASLEGLVVPYGIIESTLVFGDYQNPGDAPVKSVRLDGPNVNVQAGAVIDVSGGGDLLAWRFLPGNGGKTDILAYDADNFRFAIVPGMGTRPLPKQPYAASGVPGSTHSNANVLQDPRLKAGDTVWLEAVPGLAAGYYTLLPPAYALLPGGMLVAPMSGGYAAAQAPVVRPDGAVMASGYYAVDGTPIRDRGYTRFLVMNQETFGAYSEIQTFSFNTIAKNLAASAGATVRTPFDAGAVILAATQTLALDGTGLFGASEGALRGNLDIAAAKLAVVGAGRAAPAGFLKLDAYSVSAFGAGSLLIGGTRTSTAAGTSVSVIATDVIVDNDATTPLVGSEIILAAKNNVTVRDDSVITAAGPTIDDRSNVLLSGDSAMLRLSTGGRVGVVRTGATGVAGDLTIGARVRLTAAGSMVLDANRALSIAPDALFVTRLLDLASRRINLGQVPAGETGTTLGLDTVARLASASDLLLRGQESIHLYGNIVVGGRNAAGDATLSKLTLDTGLLQGHADAGVTTTIAVGELTLMNGAAPTSVAATAGPGLLALDVDTLVLSGAVRLGGYATLQGNMGMLRAAGSGSLEFAGNVALATAVATAASGVDYAMIVGGSMALTQSARGFTQPTAPGGRLSIEAAADIHLASKVILPAGVFQATAGGAISVGPTALIDVSGNAVDMRDIVRFAPGGMIRLTATTALDLAPGAVLDVSASARGGDAGSISLKAGAAAMIAATLRGAASSNAKGGDFALDAAAVHSFSVLNAGLNAGGFDHSRDIRLRQQGITLAAGEMLRAHDVSLRSDTGTLIVAGTIDAAGTAGLPDAGTVRLTGGTGVVLESTASIDAHAGAASAGGFEPSSGKVEITALDGRLDVAPGAMVNVAGGGRGGGTIVIRARRSGNDIAIDRLAGSFLGARLREIDGIAAYASSTVDAALVGALLGDASAWLGNAGAIQARLGRGDFAVRPGMLVVSAGDLAVNADIDLSSLGGAGYLGFVAGGNIAVGAVISDGFASAARSAALLTGRSFSYGFESGGDLTVAANAMIRTGTGDIAISAGQDVKLVGQNSVIYTAGQKTATEAGFNPALLGTARVGEFATEGGNVRIVASRDITAPLTQQTTSAWLFRYGDSDWNGSAATSKVLQQTSWSVVYKNFEQGVGALGGGDVKVDAGRDIKDLAVSIPTTGHMTTSVGSVAQASQLHVRGGGDLELVAGRDLLGGLFMLGKGEADLVAGRRASASADTAKLRAALNSATFADGSVAALFGLMDATARLTVVSNASIQAAFDPMLQSQITENLTGTPALTGSGFYGYSNRTALDVTAVGGAVTYRNDPWASIDVSRGHAFAINASGAPESATPPRPSQLELLGRAPGTLKFTSLEASVLMTPRFASLLKLASTPLGNLELVAKQDVRIAHTATSTSITMEDVAPDFDRGPLVAFSTTRGATGAERTEFANTRPLYGASAANNMLRGFTPLHANDREIARIYALEGSICNVAATTSCAAGGSAINYFNVILPKAAAVYAGRDIVFPNLALQHNQTDAWSSIVAGRNVRNPSLTVAGPGTFLIEAGRDIDLGTGNISTAGGGGTGNLALPRDRAAEIVIMAGAANATDYDGFASAYLDPANSRGVARTYLAELADYMRKIGHGELTGQDLLTAFNALPRAHRQAFLLKVYFTELKETGIEYNDPASGRYQNHNRGYRAVATLFATDPRMAVEGNLILNSRPVDTLVQADISMVAPYGRVEIGTKFPPVNYTPNTGGVVTRRGGDVRIMADRNIDLFTSRVFTLQGGDVTMWTSNGDITAGSGTKTSVFQVPLSYTMSNDGVIDLNVFGLQTGAGIGVLDSVGAAKGSTVVPATRKRSRIDLLAFRGEVNAGDAGIRVLGDINIAALRIVGLDNIQVVGGVATGIPKAAAPAVAPLVAESAAATAGNAAKDAVQQSTQNDRPSVIIVEVLGYGGGDDGAPSETDQRRPDRRSYDVNSKFQIVGAGRLNELGEKVLTEAEKRALSQQ